MISFFRYFTTLLAMTTLAAVAQTPDLTEAELFAKCQPEVTAIFTCLTSNGVTNATFLDASVTSTCDECFRTTESFGNDTDLVGKPCAEVQLKVDEALVECAPKCKLEGCTTELTGLMGCVFKSSVACADGVLAAPPPTAPVPANPVPANPVPAPPVPAPPADGTGKTSNTPVSGGAFFTPLLSVVASGIVATTAVIVGVM